MKKDKEWLKNEVKSLFDEAYDSGKMEYYESEESIHRINNLVDQLDEPEVPVIPKFVADYIEENECLSLIYIGFKLFNNRIKDEDLNDWISNNQEQFCRAFLAWPNVEVEKEKLYRVRAGNRYVRFNLDGSIIGVKKDNSIVCLERLSKLPFDYKKAVDSGIIRLEEVTE